ncbi:MAG TPA: DNA-directed RNA polymerase subunit alpha [Fibrobacteria bacterium]|nr:DNA-directed RNA polymerase subunit alpha [Fibrobacteria bacterium]
MKWKALQMPKGVVKSPSSAESFGKFTVEPLERGWGVTVGNALRRVLLSSLQGARVVAIRIDGAPHEFGTIPGVKEDITDLVLNLKQLRLKLHSDRDARLKLDVTGEGEVRASAIEANPDVVILNSDLHIATLDKNASLSIEMRVSSGRGYAVGDDLKRPEDPIGWIYLDTHFSPVTKVNLVVEDTRVGQKTDFNKLTLEINTDGSITPEDSLAYAAKLLVDHFELFINFEGELEQADTVDNDGERERIAGILKMRVDELELSVRSSNCLRMANIHTIADLVRNTEQDMLKYKNFGRKSLVELNEVLQGLGLGFGVDVDRYLND